MPEWITLAVMIGAAVTSGLMAGVFLAFSTFVMAGLRDLPDAQGLAAMQAVNRRAPTGVFIVALLAAAVLALAAIVTAFLPWTPASWLVVTGGLASLGQFAMTVAFHVPRNERLAVLATDDPASPDAWRAYARVWTAGNHVRTALSLAGLVLLIGAAVLR